MQCPIFMKFGAPMHYGTPGRPCDQNWNVEVSRQRRHFVFGFQRITEQ